MGVESPPEAVPGSWVGFSGKRSTLMFCHTVLASWPVLAGPTATHPLHLHRYAFAWKLLKMTDVVTADQMTVVSSPGWIGNEDWLSGKDCKPNIYAHVHNSQDILEDTLSACSRSTPLEAIAIRKHDIKYTGPIASHGRTWSHIYMLNFNLNELH